MVNGYTILWQTHWLMAISTYRYKEWLIDMGVITVGIMVILGRFIGYGWLIGRTNGL